jgi:hypothetical protein
MNKDMPKLKKIPDGVLPKRAKKTHKAEPSINDPSELYQAVLFMYRSILFMDHANFDDFDRQMYNILLDNLKKFKREYERFQQLEMF